MEVNKLQVSKYCYLRVEAEIKTYTSKLHLFFVNKIALFYYFKDLVVKPELLVLLQNVCSFSKNK